MERKQNRPLEWHSSSRLSLAGPIIVRGARVVAIARMTGGLMKKRAAGAPAAQRAISGALGASYPGAILRPLVILAAQYGHYGPAAMVFLAGLAQLVTA